MNLFQLLKAMSVGEWFIVLVVLIAAVIISFMVDGSLSNRTEDWRNE